MTILDVIVLLIIAGLCGALGRAISGFSRGGCLVSIALGLWGRFWNVGWRACLDYRSCSRFKSGPPTFPSCCDHWFGSIRCCFALLTRSRA